MPPLFYCPGAPARPKRSKVRPLDLPSSKGQKWADLCPEVKDPVQQLSGTSDVVLERGFL